jgi:DNA topoisomerase-1
VVARARGKRDQVEVPTAALDPIVAADEAELVYVSDAQPGIRRWKAGSGFRYVDERGHVVRSSVTLARIKTLAIPPAWTDVWICPLADGHIQASGRDARGRKQYRYHERWREVRDRTKFERTLAFGEALPALRERVDADLALPGLPRQKVLATVVRLLETTLIRVGNREYAQDNGSYGLTTLRDRHVKVDGSTLRFEFTGKGGKKHSVSIRDRRLATVVRDCQEIRGHELFQYLDEGGVRQTVGSADVNQYLREATGQEFSAKDFRTWAGTVLAVLALRELEACGEAETKRSLLRAVEEVAKSLGNTPAICRRCYIHPEVIDRYLEGTLLEALQDRAENAVAAGSNGRRAEEAAVLSLLRNRLHRQ